MRKFQLLLRSGVHLVVALSFAGGALPSFGQLQNMPDDLPIRNSGSGGSTLGGGLSGLSGLNIGGAGGVPSLRTIDGPLSSSPQQAQQQQALEPLKPNDFQRFVLETAGYKLPLYGQDFFDNLPFNPVNNAPVSGDYPLGSGDQVLVRGWGSLDIDARLVVDRNGMVSIPRVGSVALVGVKANQAEGVVRAAVGKYYKGFELSVTLGQLRAITVYVVGQARRPGSYAISSVSTLASGLFATGGPNATGTMRRVQLKRSGKVIAELDLYKFLASGDDAAEVKLIDGDVIVIPPAYGHIALVGKVNNPAVYEIKSAGETLDDIIKIAGGLPVVADARRVTLERLDATQSQPRSVQDFALNAEGLKTILKNGDMLTVVSIAPELSNAVTLRGNVSTPMRVMWREGLRIRDLIPNKEALISRDSIRRQNETLFDASQRERTQRDRDLKPDDLVSDSDFARRASVNKTSDAFDMKSANSQGSATVKKRPLADSASLVIDSLSDSIGHLYDEINWDYALIERLNRQNLTVSLVSFNLARALADEKSKDNQLLQAGDIVTVFSVNDVRIPQAKRRVMVRIEGEVAEPGIYHVAPGETLQDVLSRAGGVTQDAYLYGAALYRDEVRKIQTENLRKLVARLESDSSTEISKIGAGAGASADGVGLQVRMQSAQQAQRQAVQSLRQIKPEGRVALGVPPVLKVSPSNLPDVRMRNGDRFVVPPRPDYVYVYGAVNTESALLYTPDSSVRDYLKQAGLTESGDRDAVVLLRANGSALSTNNGSWFGGVLGATVMPGDSILVPQKTDLEPMWSAFTRNTKDITQIFYQLGLGAAAIKTLRN
jgi:protein involved in polysaccharide export with SLBB domain